MRKKLSFNLLFVTVLLVSCNTSFHSNSLHYHNYRVAESENQNSFLQKELLIYSDSVNSSMSSIVGFAYLMLEKKQPESTLGNFIADAMLVMANEKYSMKVDAAIANYGGIRINQLSAGAVSKGKIFELMPFDNLVVIQKIRGDVLQQFLDLSAAKGGWPLAGITMKIKNQKAIDVTVNNEPIDFSTIYTVVNSDYVANGGDQANMLRNIPQQSIGYLLRDAIFDYIKVLQKQGKNIIAFEEKRVTYVE